MKRIGIYGFLFLVFAVTIGLYFGLNYLENHTGRLGIYGEEDHVVEDFTLINQDGEEFNSSEYDDHIWLVHYFFTSCPSICPEMMRTMQSVHNIVRNEEDVLLLSITVDPKRDDPERLSLYMEKFNVDLNKWMALTGDKKKLYRLARKSFLVSATEGLGDDSDFIHSENIVVIDKERRIRSIVNGTAERADNQLINAISKLKKEKS